MTIKIRKADLQRVLLNDFLDEYTCAKQVRPPASKFELEGTEEIAPSRDKVVPILFRFTPKRGSILSLVEGTQPAGMTFS